MQFINTVLSQPLWLAQLLWTMYFTYKLLSQTLDTDLNYILHFLLYTIVVFIVLIQLLLLHEINHYYDEVKTCENRLICRHPISHKLHISAGEKTKFLGGELLPCPYISTPSTCHTPPKLNQVSVPASFSVHFNYSTPSQEQSIAISLPVCLCACLSVSISLELLDWSSRIFCAYPVAMALSSCGGVVIHYVLPFLWMMYHLAVVDRMAMLRRLNL